MNSNSSTQVAVETKKRFKFKKPNKGAAKEVIGKLSQGLMMPIAVLPIAGLLLGIGAAIATNAGDNEALKIFGLFMKNAGDFVFGNLSVLFAVAIAIAFTKDAGVAALSALIAWISFNGMQSALIIPTGDTFSMLYWTGLPSAVFGTNVGIQSLQTSVFGGAIVGFIVATLYNRFYQIQMPKILGFFSGTRFVPIISLIAMIPLALIFAMIWPGIGLGLNYIGIGLGTLSANGGINAFIFGYIERALVPTGLHHAFYSPLWYTSAGGNMTNVNEITPFIHLDGQVYAVIGYVNNGTRVLFTDLNITNPTWLDIIKGLNGNVFNNDDWGGDQKLWFALNSNLINKELILAKTVVSPGDDLYRMTFPTFCQNTWNIGLDRIGAVVPTGDASALYTQLTNNKNGTQYSPENFNVAFPGVNPGQYQQGKFPFMIFGLPAAAGAMIMAAPKDNRKYAFSIIGSAALTSFLTGITEPLEFTFLFLAPWLYWGVHAVLCAFSFWFMSLFGANLGMTFSGGFIDFTVYGILPDALGGDVHSWAVPIIGAVYIPIYFLLFYFLVKRFDLKTPGRGGELINKKKYFEAKANSGASSNDVDANNQSQNFTHTQYLAYKLIDAFGGYENITAVNACITKLRVSIKDKSKIDENLVKELGAQGIMYPSPTLAHAIFGTDSEPIKTQMNNVIGRNINVDALKQFVDKVDNNEDPSADSTSTSPTSVNLPQEVVVHAPLSGKIVSLKQVKDETFANNIMGEGVAFEPDASVVISPSDKEAKVDVAFPTGHAYVVDVNGIKVMIHIGLETVGLNANATDPNNLVGFKPSVKTGDSIAPNAKLVDVDFDFIKNKNLDTITPVVVLKENLDKYDLTLIPSLDSHVNAGEPLFKLTLKKS